jgi:transposase
MNLYSMDLRDKVLSAVNRGTLRQEVAKNFSVIGAHQALAQAQYRDQSSLGPKKGTTPGGGPPTRRKGAALEEWLPAQFEANPDLTLEEHREASGEERGVRVSTATTVSRAI